MKKGKIKEAIQNMNFKFQEDDLLEKLRKQNNLVKIAKLK